MTASSRSSSERDNSTLIRTVRETLAIQSQRISELADLIEAREESRARDLEALQQATEELQNSSRALLEVIGSVDATVAGMNSIARGLAETGAELTDTINTLLLAQSG